MIRYEELPLLTQDKSLADISLMYEELEDKRTIFRESCKNFILDFIPDWASEDEPYECDLFTEWEGLGGFSFRNNITAIWRDENRNLVFDTEKEEEAVIDYFQDEELLQIIEQLDKS